MSWVREIQLTNFRCYAQARLGDLAAGPVILYGPNGAGKTNVLEAVSYLAPGRGMRGAKMTEIQRRAEETDPWSIAAKVETPYGETRIGTGCDPVRDSKRIVRINGAAAKGQNALGEYLSCVWLTPQMDGLFIEGAAGRRRFLDRLVFAFDPSHSGRVTRYENALRQRSKLLQDGSDGRGADPAWLEGLEQTMAESGVAIAAARQDFTGRLQHACDHGEDETFPRARLRAVGTVEELLQNAPALEVEELFRYQLRESREIDSRSGGAASGPHKSDLAVFYAAKDMPADQCSTGEQKALLIGMILAHARLINAERGAPPILLLDEVAAHLDDHRRTVLHDILLSLGGQVWLTGTDKQLFADLQGRAVFCKVENSTVHAESALKVA
ncbi:MAG: DNA replication/repair protein RecF [Rhodospirillales bacterium]|nr:DNA replication/repair protein RecF [Rhodospirillales bacterium]MCB9996313.1 DNA replication/repair protein RecF [Rhodospirillales bacterium]